jgi:hypothetical protein
MATIESRIELLIHQYEKLEEYQDRIPIADVVGELVNLLESDTDEE